MAVQNGDCKLFGCLFSYDGTQYIQTTNKYVNMYSLFEERRGLLAPKAQAWRMQRFFLKHLKSAMLVIIGKLLSSTPRWVPICHDFSQFSAFLCHFIMAKLATSSIGPLCEPDTLTVTIMWTEQWTHECTLINLDPSPVIPVGKRSSV